MGYQTTRIFKSLARGGVSLSANQPVTSMAFTATQWARLLKDGDIVWVTEPEADALEEMLVTEVNATKSATKLAAENGIDLAGIVGSGVNGRITLSDVKAVLNA